MGLGKVLMLALVIALIAVGIDFSLHYTLPETVNGVPIAFRESSAYFAAKIVVFGIIAALFLGLGLMSKVWGPLVYGLVASASFGAFYYLYPSVSVGTGSMPLPGKALWGGIHWGCGTIAAGIVMRKPASVLLGILILIVSVGTLLVFGPMLLTNPALNPAPPY